MADEILVELYDDDADPAELDRLTRALRQEILGVDDVDTVSAATTGPAPDGTRGIDAAAIGALVVGVAPTLQALAKIVDVLRGFVSRPRGAAQQTLKLTVNGEVLELTPTAAQQQALVEAFLKRAATA